MRRLAYRGLLLALAACAEGGSAADRAPVDVLVSVRRGTITAPDTIRPGWARVRVKEDRDGHIVVIFRLPVTASPTDIASFLAALDSLPTTPPPGTAMGGPEVGDVGDVIVHFTPGTYLLGCVRRGQD